MNLPTDDNRLTFGGTVTIRVSKDVRDKLRRWKGDDLERIVTNIKTSLADSLQGENADVRRVPSQKILTGYDYRAVKFDGPEHHEWVALARPQPTEGPGQMFVITAIEEPAALRSVGVDFGRHATGLQGKLPRS